LDKIIYEKIKTHGKGARTMEIKIGVVADTHIPRKAIELPKILLEKLQGVDMIIHAGDLVDFKVIHQLEQIAPVEVVAGNVDPARVRDRLPRKKLISVGEYSLGIVHGDGTHGTTIQRARQAFAGQKPDCIIFGHSHIPAKEWLDGVLMLNPGSPTDWRGQLMPSFGMLTLGETLTSDIIYFDA
jgi:putative phosphoesterase